MSRTRRSSTAMVTASAESYHVIMPSTSYQGGSYAHVDLNNLVLDVTYLAIIGW